MASSGSVDLTVRVPATAAVGTLLTNTAAITTSTPQLGGYYNTDVDERPVTAPKPDLWLSKQFLNELPSLVRGAENFYTIEYWNLVGSAAVNSVLTDILPAGMTFVSASPITPAVSGGQLVWDLGTVPGTGARGIDPHESDDYFMTVTDFLTPSSLYWGTLGQPERAKLKSLPAFFNASGLEISQHETTSRDGTRVPYFQVSRKGLALNGISQAGLIGGLGDAQRLGGDADAPGVQYCHGDLEAISLLAQAVFNGYLVVFEDDLAGG